jgi:anti-sigma factor RsiW
MAHVADRLQALVSGSLPAPERAAAEAHLSACPHCREERELLLSARGLIEPLPPRDARVGFAAKVAYEARDRRATAFARWLRWAFSGVAAAGLAAVGVALLVPAPPVALASDEVRIAHRLELFEDLAVLQNREALEDIEVVSVLHTLEARP